MEENASVVLDLEDRLPSQVEGRFGTRCWGCKIHLVLPHLAADFKCGWCGALTFSARLLKRKRWIRCMHLRDKLLVSMVFAIIVCITGGGLLAIYPVLFPKTGFTALVNIALTTVLALNTIYNYCLSAFLPAGTPSRVPWGSTEVLSKGALDDYTFCIYCTQPKPPQAHHCRTCSTCVMEMDHHCPFIGNCVGANNHRYFILFLLYTLVSVCYVLVMSMLAAFKVWPDVLNLYDPDKPRTAFEALSTILSASFMDAFDEDLATRSLALIYLIILSIAVGIGLSMLLWQQLQLLYEGQTYVDSLQSQQVAVAGWQNLRRVFGSRHPLVWLLPSFPCKSRDKLH